MVQWIKCKLRGLFFKLWVVFVCVSFSYTCFLLLAAVTFPFTVTVAAYVKVFRKFAASKRKFAAARQEQKKAAMKAAQAGNAGQLFHKYRTFPAILPPPPVDYGPLRVEK